MKVAGWCTFVAMFQFFIVGTTHAREFDVLARTGQTKCYDSIGNAIACAGTGQDGDLRKGIPWPRPRFEDHGDGTITDILTGLMWLKDANCAHTIQYNPDGEEPIIGNMSWLNALDFVKKMNAGAIACSTGASKYNDWHLPTPRELESLINYGASDNSAWLTKQGFINVKAKQLEGCIDDDCPYWTATTNLGWSDAAVAVELQYSGIYMRSKYFNHYNPSLTWPVRRDATVVSPSAPVLATGQTECYGERDVVIPCLGTGQDGETQRGQKWTSNRFIDHYDGTVTDVFTNLMWLKSFPTGNAEWQYALDYARGMNAGVNDNYGYTGWRIPNAREALSLISWKSFRVALPTGHPFNMAWGNASWASTYYAFTGGDSAVMTDFYYGGQTANHKTLGGSTYLPVRSLMFRNAVGNFYQSSGTYATGQCVPYVRYETGLPREACSGKAHQCFEQAQRAGYITGSIPRVGSVVVFAADLKKRIPNGHVAIVTAINGSELTMQDQNWVERLRIGVHTENVSNFNILGYIYP